jgi:uncharacterized membrane protein
MQVWWLPYNRYCAIQGSLSMSLQHICATISSRWLQVWLPGNVVVIDESVYEYLGESPVHVCDPSRAPLS